MAHHHAPVFGTSCRPFSSTFRMAESAGVEPASLLQELLCSRQVPYRPAHSPFITWHRYASLRRPPIARAISALALAHPFLRGFRGKPLHPRDSSRAPLPIANCCFL